MNCIDSIKKSLWEFERDHPYVAITLRLVISLFIAFAVFDWLIKNVLQQPQFEAYNVVQGSISAFGIIVGLAGAFVLYNMELRNSRIQEYEKQKRLLRSVLIKLEYFSSGKVMKIFGKGRRISHTTWLTQLLNEIDKGVLAVNGHPLLEINPDFYAENLAPKIDEKSTYDIVKALYLINDKQKMINIYSSKIRDMIFKRKSEEIQKEELQDIYSRYVIPFILDPLKEAVSLSQDTKEYINTKFKVYISENKK